jgi:hypothetical protein
MQAAAWQTSFRRHGAAVQDAATSIGPVASRLIRQIAAVGAWRLGVLAWALAGVMYVNQAWTPSHYSIVFALLGLEQGPTLGLAQTIRSDEATVVTPYFQIAVRSGFGPRDEISPYREPLKSFWALPIADWGLVFKPQM